MKITFFKDESYFYPRTSYFWKNAEQVKQNKNLVRNRKIYVTIFNWVFIIMINCYIIIARLLFNQRMSLGFYLTGFAVLPLHEFCHALYAHIIKKKIVGIRFFPYNYGFTWSKAGAYVKLDFCFMNKKDVILFASFPLILLTCIPLLISIFFPSSRILLIYLAFINVGTSVFDIFDTVQILQVPRNAIYFQDCCWLIPTSDQPISIHRIRKIRDEDKLQHDQWLFKEHQLIKVDEPEIDEQVDLFVRDFQKQFGANCHI